MTSITVDVELEITTLVDGEGTVGQSVCKNIVMEYGIQLCTYFTSGRLNTNSSAVSIMITTKYHTSYTTHIHS